jgi:oxygen-independent coproporphyrinogen-3 oxidase
MSDWGLYIHIPWCRSRCPYCAFNTYVEDTPAFEAYTNALIEQWEALKDEFSGRPSTIFFGGGTPSLHPPDLIAQLIEVFQPLDEAEVTLEANPGTVGAQQLSQFRAAGVNRVSLGIQTFNPKHARFLNRGHSVNDAMRLLEEVAATGFHSWSADLIFALPHQTLEDFAYDLDALADAAPPHVSLYGLTAEPGTPYTKALQKGRFPKQNEELWESMFDLALQRLEAQGLQRYEVSNLAQTGHRSQHNSLYWRGHHWAGLGAGAHGWHPSGRRVIGHSKPEKFIASPTTWEDSHTPNSREAAVELLLSTLRHIDGIPLSKLERLGFCLQGPKVNHHIHHGLLIADSGCLRVAGRGWKLIDSLLVDLEASLSPSLSGPSSNHG